MLHRFSIFRKNIILYQLEKSKKHISNRLIFMNQLSQISNFKLFPPTSFSNGGKLAKKRLRKSYSTLNEYFWKFIYWSYWNFLILRICFIVSIDFPSLLKTWMSSRPMVRYYVSKENMEIKEMQQVYRRTPIQSNFIEITLRHGCSPVNLQHIFRTPIHKNTYERLLLNLNIF